VGLSQGNIYMLVGRRANITLQVGKQGRCSSTPVSTKCPTRSLRPVKRMPVRPVQYIINTTRIRTALAATNPSDLPSGHDPPAANVTNDIRDFAGRCADPGERKCADENERADGQEVADTDRLHGRARYVSRQREDALFNGEPIEIILQPNALTGRRQYRLVPQVGCESAPATFSIPDGYPVIDVEKAARSKARCSR